MVLTAPMLAHAVCFEPTFVPPQAPIKPAMPQCVVQRNCAAGSADAYIQQIKSWVAALEQYPDAARYAADLYARRALAFAQCELDANLPGFPSSRLKRR